VLVGHSLGGTVALLAALHAVAEGKRGTVSRLILIGAPAFPQRLPRFFRLLSRPGVGLLLRLLPVRYVARRSLETVYADPALLDERHIARYVPSFRGRGTIRALVETVRSLGAERPEETIAQYRNFELPSLLIWGEEDRVVKSCQGERLARELPEGRLELVERCGHNPHEERPEETWRLISVFLEERLPPLAAR
jgi:pimeloyl-ACP methyl ester carboxylesterase